MTELTLLTRPGCHLCETMKAVVARVDQWYPIVLNEIDISARPDLERKFGNDIPVLINGDQIIARHRISASQLTAALVPPSEPTAERKKKRVTGLGSPPPVLRYLCRETATSP